MTQGGSGFKRFDLGTAGAACSGRERQYFVHKATKAAADDVCAVSFVAFAMAKEEISVIKGASEGSLDGRNRPHHSPTIFGRYIVQIFRFSKSHIVPCRLTI
jgi:hypothetical protein